MSNTNTIIQEKVKELNNEVEKYPDLKFAIDRLRMAGALNLERWLTEALTSLVKEVREEEKKSEKANIEKHMVYLFRRLPEWFVQKPRYMSKQKKDSLWGNMCTWTNQYIADLKSK